MKKTLILATILLPVAAHALEFQDYGAGSWTVFNNGVMVDGSYAYIGNGGDEVHSLQEYEMMKMRIHNEQQNQRIIETIQAWQNEQRR